MKKNPAQQLRYILLLFVAIATCSLAAAPPTNGERDRLAIEQQTSYHVDPIKIRVVGNESFKVHRIELVAEVPVAHTKPFKKGAPIPNEDSTHLIPNGKLSFYGACADANGLWHWGDCDRYETHFSMDVLISRRFEWDPSGLGRPGYVIRRLENGSPKNIDADEKVLFFNGPPSAAEPQNCSCPYRLVINTKNQNEIVQAISMEPLFKRQESKTESVEQGNKQLR